MLGLALGVQTPIAPGELPPNTEVFVDSTGTFGPNLTPFVAVEVEFNVQNVLADVTGYYEGGDNTAIDEATTGTIDAASSIGNWLASQTHSSERSVLPLRPDARGPSRRPTIEEAPAMIVLSTCKLELAGAAELLRGNAVVRGLMKCAA